MVTRVTKGWEVDITPSLQLFDALLSHWNGKVSVINIKVLRTRLQIFNIKVLFRTSLNNLAFLRARLDWNGFKATGPQRKTASMAPWKCCHGAVFNDAFRTGVSLCTFDWFQARAVDAIKRQDRVLFVDMYAQDKNIVCEILNAPNVLTVFRRKRKYAEISAIKRDSRIGEGDISDSADVDAGLGSDFWLRRVFGAILGSRSSLFSLFVSCRLTLDKAALIAAAKNGYLQHCEQIFVDTGSPEVD